MTDSRRRLITLVVVAAVAVPLAVAATAFACARLATLKLDRAGGTPGDRVTAVGRNFNSTASSSPVSIRFNSRNGRVLWEGRPDAQGRFRGTFEIPRGRAGHYVILATQSLANGSPAPGTPGRAPLRIRRADASRSVAVVPPGTGAGPSGPPAGVGLVGALALLALGGAAAVGRVRSRSSLRSVAQPS
ncbi:MAG TPA: hypothetical protein VM266_17360 [Solirubrobacteraceae bacterium]|nr:hypothetical protein [Solirubrobacteraceae bacterium]